MRISIQSLSVALLAILAAVMAWSFINVQHQLVTLNLELEKVRMKLATANVVDNEDSSSIDMSQRHSSRAEHVGHAQHIKHAEQDEYSVHAEHAQQGEADEQRLDDALRGDTSQQGQIGEESCVCTNDDVKHSSDEKLSTTMKFNYNTMTLKDWEAVGQIFMPSKISEIVMDDSTLHAYNMERQVLDEEVITAGFATDILSVAVPQSEYQQGKLSEKSAAAITERMAEWGVVALQGAMPRNESTELAKLIREGVMNPDYDFGSISESDLRKDYPLAFEPWNADYFENVVELIYPVLEKMLGPDAKLVEYSSILTFPNAKAQGIHPDAGMERLSDIYESALVYSVFVYLTDVSYDMAALDVRPKTHTHFQFLIPEELNMIEAVPKVRMAVPTGSIVIMDSRTYHRGSANTSPKERPVFYFSFMSSKGEPPTGPTYSLRREYILKLNLQDAIAKRSLQVSRGIDSTHIAMMNTTRKENNSKSTWTLPLGIDRDYDYSAISSEDMMLDLESPPPFSGIVHPMVTMEPPVVMLSTLNFTQFIDNNDMSLICFFDPRSAAYITLKDVYVKAARLLEGVAVVAGINIGRDAYLARELAWELFLGDQDPGKTKSFEFGQPNYLPLIVHLFYNGSKLVEYTGVHSPEAIYTWVSRAAAMEAKNDRRNIQIVQDRADLVRLKASSESIPLVIGCFEEAQMESGSLIINDVFAGGNEKELATKLSEAVDEHLGVNMTGFNSTHDWVAFVDHARLATTDYTFARVQSDKCAGLLGQESTSGTVTLFPHSEFVSEKAVFSFPNVSTTNIMTRRLLLEHFLETRMKSMHVGELTPDNSHTFLDQAEPVLLILCHKDEENQNRKAKKLAVDLSSHIGFGKLLLSWADGPIYSSQFNIENKKKSFPALVLLSKIDSNAIKSLPKKKRKTLEKKLGRLPSDMVEFTTYVYKRKFFGKVSRRNLMRWVVQTDIIPAYDEFEAGRLLAFYQTGNVTNASILNTSSGSHPANVSSVVESVKANRTDQNKIVNVSSNSSATSKNTSSIKNSTKVDRDPIRISYPAYAMERLYHNFQLLGTYERLIQRQLRESGRSRLTATDKLFHRRVRELRSSMQSNFPGIEPPAMTPEHLKTVINNEDEFHNLKRSIESFAKLSTKMYNLDEREAATPEMSRYVDADEYLRNGTRKLIQELEKSFLKDFGGKVTPDDIQTVQIDRVHWKKLSMRLFMKKYAGASRPVVITGLSISKQPWTLEHIKKKCGNRSALLRKRMANSTQWGGLEDAETLTISDFIDTFRTNGKS